LARTLRAGWAQQLADLGLTPPQAAVLRGVAGRPGCSLRALARVLGAEPMTVKRCVDDLEVRGLLESAHRGEDRRPRALELTPAGRALTGHLDVLVQHRDARLGAVLGPERRGRLEEALGTLEDELGLPPADRVPERARTEAPDPRPPAGPLSRPTRVGRPSRPRSKEQR
jgi:DNA-binding MarR family transcriptional regulator